MDRKNLLSIGDVARLFHISVSSLRHYERVGLLLPQAIDPHSGYRYYSTEQFEVLNTIRYLRALDMPLPEIADFLQNREVANIEEKLRHQKEIVLQKQAELTRVAKKIDHRLAQLADARSAPLNAITELSLPACRIVWVENPLKIEGFLDMEAPIRRLDQSEAEAVVFLGKVGVGISEEHLLAERFETYDGVFLVLDQEDLYDGAVTILPETTCVRVRFRGSHGEAPAQYRRLLDYIRSHSLRITGFSREITLIDYGITNDVEKCVTEISIPVRRIRAFPQ